ncbi:hypothetical protein DICVIV_03467 [Dictyocaulus viviparus]|uniref:THAP4-like heme-binding domain-containing protein n=1 Tax=Dictyocaulus viviparus TaxID=29172 RepID=A0A0D8Y2J4_DICVI|nr:hypothetical protein DICVIV_03467 [Dictyocaulus viviparus]
MFMARVNSGNEKDNISPDDSDFFQLNCPVACEKCKPSNNTKKIDRLPAVLLPLSWILGEWNTKVKGFSRIAFDFPLDFKSSGFNETLTFSVAKPLMFGTPSINYTCIAVSYDDPYDIHMHSGFLTIRQYPPKNETTSKVALMSVNNQGE